jgi:hypothetical protein
MKPRALGGAIGRADAIFVWVPYAEVEYEDVEEPEDGLVEVAEVLSDDPEDLEDPDLGDPEEEEEDDEPEEIGYWLAVTKVQARELVADACTSEIEDLEIVAEETAKGLYIGLGPLPE